LLIEPDKRRVVYFNKIKSQQTLGISISKSELENYFRFNEMLHFNFRQCTIGIWLHEFTMIPVSIENERLQKKALSFNAGNDNNVALLKDNLGGLNFLGSIDSGVKQWLKSNFNDAEIINPAASLLRHFSKQLHADSSNQLIAYVNEGFLEILYVKKGDTQYYNAFSYESIEDAIYFILLVFNQMGLSTQEDILTLAGEIMPDSNLYIGLYKYIRNIQFAPFPADLQIESEGDLNNHRYLNLFLL
jgi:Protein of unknown function (DUF3822)